jgi:hypothetical protein
MEAISKEESSQRNLEEMSLEGRRREQPARRSVHPRARWSKEGVTRGR